MPTDPPFLLIPPVISKPMRLLMMACSINGAAVLLGLVFHITVSPALKAGPDYVEAMFGLMMMAGGAMLQLSTLNWRQQSTTWKLELFGWPILGAAWALYVVISLLLPAPLIFPVIVGAGFISASAYRLSEVLRSIRVGRKQVARMKNGEGHA